MSEFFHGIPAQAILEVLNHLPDGKPYPDSAAIMSLMLDVEADSVKKKKDYERIWGWSEKQVRYHWARLIEEARKWIVWNGKREYKVGATLGRSKGDVGASSEDVNSISALDEGDRGATEGRPRGEHIIQTTDTEEENTNTSSSRKSPKVWTFSDWDMRVSQFCEELLLQVGNLKKPISEAERNKWADEFRKLREIDGWDKDTIKRVLNWLFREDDWWVSSGNFCSVLKFRRKKDGTTFFQRFEIASRAPVRRNGKHDGASPDAIAREVAKTMAPGS